MLVMLILLSLVPRILIRVIHIHVFRREMMMHKWSSSSKSFEIRLFRILAWLYHNILIRGLNINRYMIVKVELSFLANNLMLRLLL